MAGPTISTYLTHFLPQYWDSVLGENLYPNLYFYQFGTKRTVPRNFGNTIKIPRLYRQNIVHAVPSEGVAIQTCPISNEYISGTMNQYAGAYKHSDVLIMTAMSDVIELTLVDIARDIAKSMDKTVRDAISGTGRALSPTVSGTTMYLKPSVIVEGVTRLDADDNPRPPDGHYPVIMHPLQAYDLQMAMSNSAAGHWLDVNKYTEQGQSKIYNGEIGRLYGARFVTSSNIARLAISTTASGACAYMLAPDAYYVTEISDMTARTYVKQLGSAGAADPVNQYATVGAKVYFGVIPVAWNKRTTEYRINRIKYATSLAMPDS